MNENVSSKKVLKKVYTYILEQYGRQFKLLVLEHVDNPEVGIQIPGGTVEQGEEIPSAALREAREETGLQDLQLVEKLGVVERDLSEFGIAEIHERHYFYFRCGNKTKPTWIAYEETPSDGSPGPIPFCFYWVDLDDVPQLSGGQDEMLPTLRTLIQK